MSMAFDKIKLGLSWIAWLITYAVMAVLFPLSFLMDVRISYDDQSFQGMQRPLIIISNHRSILDPWLIAYALPFRILFGKIFPIRTLTSIQFSEKNRVGRIFKATGIMGLAYFFYNAISLPEGGSFEQKIDPFIKALNNKQSVLLFPEGRLSSEESILEFKKGVVVLHQQTSAPILPVAIRYEGRGLFFRKVHIAIGRPFTISEEFFINSKQDNEFRSSRNFVREKVLTLYEKLSV